MGGCAYRSVSRAASGRLFEPVLMNMGLCACHYWREAVFKYVWHVEILCGCEKEIVGFGVNTLGKQSTESFLYLCHYKIWG